MYSYAVYGNNIILGTGKGVYISADDGVTWYQVNGGLSNTFIRSIAIIGKNIFVGTGGGGVFMADINEVLDFAGVPENIQDKNILLYPNPVKDIFQINSKENISSVKILNEFGITVYENSSLNDCSFRVNLNNYPVGTYFCIINAGKNMEIKKFVVIR